MTLRTDEQLDAALTALAAAEGAVNAMTPVGDWPPDDDGDDMPARK